MPATDEELRVLSAQAAITHMLARGSFNICTMRDVAKTLGRIPDPEADRILQPLHCIDYKDMAPELRDALPSLIARYLGTSWPPPSYEKQYQEAAPARRPTLIARLLTRGTS